MNSVVSEISAAIYLICVVICYPLSMAFIYCIIKILKEDAYDRGTYICMHLCVVATYVHAHMYVRSIAVSIQSVCNYMYIRSMVLLHMH